MNYQIHLLSLWGSSEKAEFTLWDEILHCISKRSESLNACVSHSGSWFRNIISVFPTLKYHEIPKHENAEFEINIANKHTKYIKDYSWNTDPYTPQGLECNLNNFQIYSNKTQL